MGSDIDRANWLGWANSQFKSFGSSSKHPETGPKSIGIGFCWFLGTAPGIWGLASSGSGVDLARSQIGDFRPESYKFSGLF